MPKKGRKKERKKEKKRKEKKKEKKEKERMNIKFWQRCGVSVTHTLLEGV